MKAVAPPRFEDPMDQIDLAPPFSCPAIARCSEAWYSTFEKELARGASRLSSRLSANAAYRYAMPPLNSLDNVRDFIACVVHGTMVGSIIDELATRWIYAAQVASSNLKAKRNIESTPKESKTSRSTSSRASRQEGTAPPPPSEHCEVV